MDETTPQNQNTREPLRRPVRQIPEQQTEKRERIKKWMAVCLITVAVCVDLAQALLTAVAIGAVLGPVISAVAWFGFWVWFMILGVSFVSNPKKLLSMGGAGIIEIIPVFGALPAFTAGVAATVFITMAEDKGGIISKAAGALQGKI
ncbi:MAG: hypothetical protein A2431_02945 [Candidatus Zambryskibacteria bacterium RIFOXYC1_FULL_39_10]|uniref:Uncharacterized protein n=1 Tax=Candidatus Zambryskibacteria bacterium RIFOXYC1_FULL_39_10 TaxID=1802779 RepID=A0A1G2V043_9BACT|nr:MAG: hypothetical protein A2605_02125 [Candidatus Zambryskibacteria bacterium RIFOXYD1_FULL_39_35]OHB14980.1 MAG: hypothetical protein A2431_02945 [Candidatus Zambryskibacteria bacterium RIFOXYC1_FULL_39_10]